MIKANLIIIFKVICKKILGQLSNSQFHMFSFHYFAFIPPKKIMSSHESKSYSNFTRYLSFFQIKSIKNAKNFNLKTHQIYHFCFNLNFKLFGVLNFVFAFKNNSINYSNFDQPQIITIKFVKLKMSQSSSSSKSSRKSLKNTEDNCKVYVSNIFKDAEQSEVKTLFEKFGEITYCVLKKKQNQVTYAFIEFVKAECAKQAVQQMNKATFYNRNLNVQFGKGGKHQQRHYENIPLDQFKHEQNFKRNRYDYSYNFSRYENYHNDRDRQQHRNHRQRKSSRSYSPLNRYNRDRRLVRKESPVKNYRNERMKDIHYRDYKQYNSRRQHKTDDYHRGDENKSKQYERSYPLKDEKYYKYDEYRKYTKNYYDNEKKYSKNKDHVEERRDKIKYNNQRQSDDYRRKKDDYSPKHIDKYERVRDSKYSRQISSYLKSYDRDSLIRENQRKPYKAYNEKLRYEPKNGRSKIDYVRDERYRKSRSRDRSLQRRDHYRKEKFRDNDRKDDYYAKGMKYERQSDSQSPRRDYERKSYEKKLNSRETIYNKPNEKFYKFDRYLNRINEDNYYPKEHKDGQNRQRQSYKKVSESDVKRKSSNPEMRFSSQRSNSLKQKDNKFKIQSINK